MGAIIACTLSLYAARVPAKSSKIYVLNLCVSLLAETEREIACKNLQQSLLTCFAEKHAIPEAEEHKKCYTKLYKTGISHVGQVSHDCSQQQAGA